MSQPSKETPSSSDDAFSTEITSTGSSSSLDANYWEPPSSSHGPPQRNRFITALATIFEIACRPRSARRFITLTEMPSTNFDDEPSQENPSSFHEASEQNPISTTSEEVATPAVSNEGSSQDSIVATSSTAISEEVTPSAISTSSKETNPIPSNDEASKGSSYSSQEASKQNTIITTLTSIPEVGPPAMSTTEEEANPTPSNGETCQEAILTSLITLSEETNPIFSDDESSEDIPSFSQEASEQNPIITTSLTAVSEVTALAISTTSKEANLTFSDGESSLKENPSSSNDASKQDPITLSEVTPAAMPISSKETNPIPITLSEEVAPPASAMLTTEEEASAIPSDGESCQKPIATTSIILSEVTTSATSIPSNETNPLPMDDGSLKEIPTSSKEASEQNTIITTSSSTVSEVAPPAMSTTLEEAMPTPSDVESYQEPIATTSITLSEENNPIPLDDESSKESPSSSQEASKPNPIITESTTVSEATPLAMSTTSKEANFTTSDGESSLTENPSSSHDASEQNPDATESSILSELISFVVGTSKSLKEMYLTPLDGASSSKEPTVTIPPCQTTNVEYSIYSFFVQLRQVSKLKMSLNTLADLEFNPTEEGRIDVDEHFFEITVSKDDVLCTMTLKKSGMLTFICPEDYEEKLVNLREMLDFITTAEDDGVVTMYHVKGSNQLTIKLSPTTECADAEAYDVNLSEVPPGGSERCPFLYFSAEAVVLTTHLREMIPKMVNKRNVARDITVRMSCTSAKIKIGKKEWVYNYDEISAPRGVEEFEIEGTYRFPFTKSLMKASFLDVGVLFCFVALPGEGALIRFNLREFGDLVYVF